MRILMLVALGASFFVVVSLSAPTGRIIDPVGIAAHVVSGAAILGAAVILQQKGSAAGITAGATIWVPAAIGMALGAGLIPEGIFVSVITYLVLGWIRRYMKI